MGHDEFAVQHEVLAEGVGGLGDVGKGAGEVGAVAGLDAHPARAGEDDGPVSVRLLLVGEPAGQLLLAFLAAAPTGLLSFVGVLSADAVDELLVSVDLVLSVGAHATAMLAAAQSGTELMMRVRTIGGMPAWSAAVTAPASDAVGAAHDREVRAAAERRSKIGEYTPIVLGAAKRLHGSCTRTKALSMSRDNPA